MKAGRGFDEQHGAPDRLSKGGVGCVIDRDAAPSALRVDGHSTGVQDAIGLTHGALPTHPL